MYIKSLNCHNHGICLKVSLKYHEKYRQWEVKENHNIKALLDYSWERAGWALLIPHKVLPRSLTGLKIQQSDGLLFHCCINFRVTLLLEVRIRSANKCCVFAVFFHQPFCKTWANYMAKIFFPELICWFLWVFKCRRKILHGVRNLCSFSLPEAVCLFLVYSVSKHGHRTAKEIWLIRMWALML